MTYHNIECATHDEDFYVCDHIYAALNQRGHIVAYDAYGEWCLEHPLSCRTAPGGLLSCALNATLREVPPPYEGRYEVGGTSEEPTFSLLS